MEIGHNQIKDLANQAYNKMTTLWNEKAVTYFSRKELNDLLKKPGVKPILALIALVLIAVSGLFISFKTFAKSENPELPTKPEVKEPEIIPVETKLLEDQAPKAKSARELAAELKEMSSQLTAKGFTFFHPSGLPIINNMITALNLYEETKNLDKTFESERATDYQDQPNNIKDTFTVAFCGAGHGAFDFTSIIQGLQSYDPDNHFGKPGAITREERNNLFSLMEQISEYINPWCWMT